MPYVGTFASTAPAKITPPANRVSHSPFSLSCTRERVGVRVFFLSPRANTNFSTAAVPIHKDTTIAGVTGSMYRGFTRVPHMNQIGKKYNISPTSHHARFHTKSHNPTSITTNVKTPHSAPTIASHTFPTARPCVLSLNKNAV